MAFFSAFAFNHATAAPITTIQEGFEKLEQFEVGYFVDQSGSMPLNEIQQQAFQPSPNKMTLGLDSETVWIKMRLRNASQKMMHLYLHKPEAFNSASVEFYQLTENKLINQFEIDTSKNSTSRWMYNGTAIFDVILPPQQETTIFVKNVVFSYQWTSLMLYSEQESKKALIGLYSDTTLFVGMLLALMIYNFLLFFSSHLKEHLYYALYLVSGGIWIALTYGLLAGSLQIFGADSLQWNLSLGFMPICLILFMMNIFSTRNKYPVEHWSLMSAVVVLTINSLYGLFDMASALSLASALATFTMIVTMLVSISMAVRKHPIGLFFLLGHSLFVGFGVLSVLFYRGLVEYNYINSHGVGVGIILEALMFSLIIAHRIRILKTLKETQEELQFQASTDPLTKLLNRRYLSIQANKLFESTPDSISIALIDIDNFKLINDSHGHAIGDNAIIHTAEAIKSSCRGKDILARYGGEEFILIMPNTPLYGAKVITERIRVELEQLTIYSNLDEPVHFTISAGVTQVSPMETGLLDAIDQADQALYQAKSSGKNQTQLYKKNTQISS